MVLGAPVGLRAALPLPDAGPHAFASTTPPMSRSACSWPSRSMVARTRSEPGVTRNGTAARAPRRRACCATSAARLMSWYDELVQLPISAVEIASAEPFSPASRTSAASATTGARGRANAVRRRAARARDRSSRTRGRSAFPGSASTSGVRLQQLRGSARRTAQVGAAGGAQVRDHAFVRREHRGRGAELRAHVGDRGLARGADRARAGADVLDDRVGAARRR